MKKITSRSVVFVTGAFVSNSCWDEWKSYFENKGYSCIAPAIAEKNAPAAELRSRQPDQKIASVRLKDVIDYYIKIVKEMPEKPIVIGHSLGGLITQILVNRDLAAAGIAIHSLAPKGIIPTQLSFYRSALKSLGFLTSTKKSYLMSFPDWQYAFTNDMSFDQQQKGYSDFAIPESKLALRDGLSDVAKVDFKKSHVPLLFTSGSIDHCIPAALNVTNYKKYTSSDSITDYKEFKGRNHFVLGQPTWKEDAEYILNWISAN